MGSARSGVKALAGMAQLLAAPARVAASDHSVALLALDPQAAHGQSFGTWCGKTVSCTKPNPMIERRNIQVPRPAAAAMPRGGRVECQAVF